MTKSKGLYLGTEIDEKWWKGYKKDKMFARGNGEYWHDTQGFYFHTVFDQRSNIHPVGQRNGYKTG